MATTKCISGNIQKLKGNAATIAQAGTVGSTENTGLSLITLAHNNREVGSVVFQAVSAASSGNLGTIRPYTAGTFGYMARGEYVGKVIGKKISGVANLINVSGANYVSKKTFNSIQTTHTGFLTALTWSSNRDGQPTYSLTQSAQAPDFNADKEITTLGNLVYRTGKPLPTQAAYPSKNSD